jgi:hypothetical protein
VEASSVTGTATITVQRGDPGLRRFGRVMRAIGLVGVVAGVTAIVAGLWLLRDVDALLGRSLVLTAESLGTVDASLIVATDSVVVVSDGLARAERTSRGLESSLHDGADLLDETGRMLRGDVASSLESVQRSMPALIQVGGTIDATLRAVDRLPVGPAYDPEEPFDETLRALRDDLDGLPEDLRSQADTIDEAGANLREVGNQGEAIAGSISDVRSSLSEAGAVLGEYRSTAGEARSLLEDTTTDLDRRLVVLRVLVVVLGLVYCAGQALPLYLGHRLAQPRAVIAEDLPASDPERSTAGGGDWST